MELELLIKMHDGSIYKPVVLDKIIWTTEIVSTPSSLRFTILGNYIFEGGEKVILNVDEKNVFFGFLFSTQNRKVNEIDCLAYDQLRYLKNKDSVVLTNKTASEILQLILKQYNLTAGTIEDTEFKIPVVDEPNSTLFDIILNLLDVTYNATKKYFILYDDFGKICLRDCEKLVSELVINDHTAEDFYYETSIDNDTYNYIKILQDSDEQGKILSFEAKDNSTQGKWGILKLTKKVDKKLNGIMLANMLLELKNRQTKSLTISNAFGDLNVRAGYRIHINLQEVNSKLNGQYMVCDKVTHTFEKDHHSMELKLINFEDFV